MAGSVPSQRPFLRTLAATVPLSASVTQEELLRGLRIIKGSVKTALFERNGKKLLIDSGEITLAPGGGVAEWALFTHHHRDQASGVSRLAAAGTKVLVPLREKHFLKMLADSGMRPTTYSTTATVSDRTWFRLRESVPVAHGVRGGESHAWEGLHFEVIDTPGHMDGSVTYLVEIGGKRVVFTGDLIYGPGKIWAQQSGGKRWTFTGPHHVVRVEYRATRRIPHRSTSST